MAILTQLISPALQWLTCVARRAVLLNLALLAMLGPTQASEKGDVYCPSDRIHRSNPRSVVIRGNVMLIKRPSWQRKSTLKAWTRGRGTQLRLLRPPGTRVMPYSSKASAWTYTPKLNKSIRLPGR